MSNMSPIPGLKVAGADDLKELLPLQVTMGFDWRAYFNQRVLEEIKKGAMWKRRLTHLKCMPDLENGLLYLAPAKASEYGAIKLEYSAPETGAELSLYVPLLRFELEREEGRQRIFQTVAKKQGDGSLYLALNVVESKSVPAKKKSAQPSAAPASQAAAAGQPAEPKADGK